MKRILFFVVALHSALALQAQGQGFVPPGASANYVFLQHTQMNGLNDARYAVPVNKTTMVNGEEVTGTPFLYDEWLSGSAVTRDGKAVDGLQLRYNAFEQKLLYQQGDQSIIVDEPLSEFRLNSVKKESKGFLLFRHGSQFGNRRDDNFYEVLKQAPSGNCLLKLNKKSLFTDGSNVLSAHKKYLDLEISYYYFNAQSKKLKKIRNDGSNLAELAGASPKAINLLQSTRLDLGSELGLEQGFDILNGQ